MADIWGNLGVDIDKGEGEWLYRVGSDVRGPMPHRQVVEKLMNGSIDVNTLVAREGTEFHPIYKVSAFTPHLEPARRAREKRESRARRKVFLTIFLLVAAVVGGAGLYAKHVYDQRRAAARREQVRLQAEADRAREAAHRANTSLPSMGLVALVSLGSEADVKIHGDDTKAARPHPARRPRRGREEGPSEPEAPAEEEVQSCKLTQQDIFGTLKGALGKLNVCVEDERKRDTQGLLPPTLELQFIVKPNGKVVEFAITDRHFRTGPLNNCLIKAFNTISFPSSTGANCPVTIPIKIAK